jgi:hypothetical protein
MAMFDHDQISSAIFPSTFRATDRFDPTFAALD